MSIHPQRDARLLGAGQMAIVSSTRAVVACADARRVCMLDRTRRLLVVGDSGDLGSESRSVFVQGSLVWTVLASGDVVAMSQADTPIIASRTVVGSVNPGWITGTGTVIVCGGASGEIVVLSAAGAIISRWAGIGDIRVGVATGAYLYLADFRGNGYILSINGTTGALAPLGTFSLPDCPDILRFAVVGTNLVLASKARGSVAIFSIATPTAPTRTSLTTYQPKRLLGVLDNVAATPLLDSDYVDVNAEYWQSATGGCALTSTLVAIANGASGQILETVLDATVAPPTASPAAGNFGSTQSVTLSSLTAGAAIRYTVDGTTPTSSSTLYTVPITVAASLTIKAYASLVGLVDSAVASFAYVITSGLSTVAAPTASPTAGTYGTVQTVTLSTVTGGATIRYTTDGSVPTSGSAIYSTPLSVPVTTTIKAYATASGMNDSTVSTFAYTITYGNINTLNFNGDTYTSVVFGGLLLVGGSFTTVTDALGAQSRQNICAIDLVTGNVASWNPGADAIVRAIMVDSLSQIWVGGDFATLGGSSRGRLGRFTSAMVLDSFDGGSNDKVFCIAQNGAAIIAGGAFTTVSGGTARVGLASFVQTTGALNAAVLSSFYAGGDVRDILITGSDIYFVGTFFTVNGSARRCGAKLTSGALVAWDPDVAAGSLERICTDGTVFYVAGSFITVQSTSRQGLAGYLAGTITAWDPGSNNSASNGVIVNGGFVYACGAFTTIGGASRNGIAKLNTSAVNQSGFNANFTAFGPVRNAQVTAGVAYVVGHFTNASGGKNIAALTP